jgi:hypothetical protein
MMEGITWSGFRRTRSRRLSTTKNPAAKKVLTTGSSMNAQQNRTVKPDLESVAHTDQREENRNAGSQIARRLEERSAKEQPAIGATEMPFRRAPLPIETDTASANAPTRETPESLVLRGTEPVEKLKQEGDAGRQERKHMHANGSSWDTKGKRRNSKMRLDLWRPRQLRPLH